MEREIKFRAWDKNNKKMLYNFLIGSQNEVFIIRDPMLPNGDSFGVCDIIPSKDDVELMQYTGLKDKNDKDIYEGDLVKYQGGTQYEQLAVIEWMNGGFTLRWGEKKYNKDDYLPDFWYSPTDVEITEVIGNIYEHPELIK